MQATSVLYWAVISELRFSSFSSLLATAIISNPSLANLTAIALPAPLLAYQPI
jgi:hypothetical protein